jgi:hypothetical protein
LIVCRDHVRCASTRRFRAIRTTIAATHGGEIRFARSALGGLGVELDLPAGLPIG